MVENPEVAGHDLVLQHGPGRDVNSVPVVGDDDHRQEDRVDNINLDDLVYLW